VDLRTVEKCCRIFEDKTNRKITTEEKEALVAACVLGESYGMQKFVKALKIRR
jgi:hypothetical protein